MIIDVTTVSELDSR